MRLPLHAIGIDIETTSLEPSGGDIIEFAAIRYNLISNKEIDRLIRLTKARLAITPEIESITGITNSMVENEKSFSEYINELTDFIGGDILFAHNASFDINFLTYHGVKFSSKVWDTFPLASIAWPEVDSYNLGTLAADLDIKVDSEHRAGGDVEVTWRLLQAIRQRLKLSKSTYQQTIEMLENAKLDHYVPLFSIGQILDKKSRRQKLFNSKTKISAKKRPKTLQEVFGADGVLGQAIPKYRQRPGQLKMVQAVKAALEDHSTLFVEAGTGSGKTYAYLAPLLLKARDGETAMVSTYTKNLQMQIFEEDLPTLITTLGLKLSVATLKGRRNYICSARLENIIRQNKLSAEDTLILIKVLTWLDHGGIGDLEKLNFSHQGDAIIRALQADHQICREQCSPVTRCQYALALEQAQAADIVIVNHALLAQLSLDSEGTLKPNHIIIDEAHHLEEALRNATSIDLSPDNVTELLLPLRQYKSAKNKDKYEKIITECKSLEEEYRSLVAQIGLYTRNHSEWGRLRLTKHIRKNADWQKILKAAESWLARLKFMLGLQHGIKKTNQSSQHKAKVDDIERFSLDFSNFITGSTERIQWIDAWENRARRGEFHEKLNDVALSIEDAMRNLVGQNRSIILTSATLTAGGSFKFLKKQLGLETATELVIPSEFPLKENMLLYFVNDSPLPGSYTFDRYAAQQIANISGLASGRLLALFTSQTAIALTYRLLVNAFNKKHIKLLAQKITGGRSNILRRFAVNDNSVLLGTDSFWEGIDVPGQSLSVVMIPKLPFPIPNDPVISGISEARGLNAFQDMALPKMILKLRQGVGRLLRVDSDRGVVIILDRRLHEHDYGKTVLKSLPNAEMHTGSTKDLAKTVADWFGKDLIETWRASHQAEQK